MPLHIRRYFFIFLLVVALVVPLQLLLPIGGIEAVGSLPPYAGTYSVSPSAADDLYVQSIATAPSRDVYTTGWFCDAVDFNPGPGTDTLTPGPAGCDGYLTHYGPGGIYRRTYVITSSDASAIIDPFYVATDNNNNVYVGGYYTGTVDFDPSANTDNHTSTSTTAEGFLMELTASGSYVRTLTWQPNSGNSSQVKSITIDSSGNLYALGNFNGTVDFDPTAGADSHSSSGIYGNSFLTKINADGTYGYTYTWTQGGTDDINMAHDSSGNIYIKGKYYANFDADPTAGTDTHTVTASGVATYLIKLNANGTYAFGYSVENAYAYNGYYHNIAIDTLGNVYYAGIYNGTADFDPTAGTDSRTGGGPYLTKLNANGTYAWTRTYSTMNNQDYGLAVVTDSSNNVYLETSFTGSVNFDPTGGTDTRNTVQNYIAVALSRFNADGSYAQTDTFMGSGTPYWEVDAMGLAIDATDNLYLAGYFYGAIDFDPSAGTDIQTANNSCCSATFLTKLGSPTLKTNPPYAGTFSQTGTYEVLNSSVVTDHNNNAYYGGDFSETVDFNPGAGTDSYTTLASQSDGYVSKVNGDGTYAKTYTFMGQTNNSYSTVNRIAVDSLNNLYITGEFYGTIDFDPGSGTHNVVSTGSNYNFFFVKLNADGTYADSYTLPTGATGNSDGKYIAVDGANNVYIAGTFGGTVDFDPSAATDNHTSTDSWNNSFLTKFNADGSYAYTYTWSQGGVDALDVVTDAANNVYLKGDYYASFDADPTAGTDTRTTTNGIGTYLIKLNSSGVYIWGKTTDGPSVYSGSMNTLALDTNGNFYLTGNFNGTYDFDPTAGTDTHSGSGAYLTKLNADGSYGYTYTYSPVAPTNYGQAVVTDTNNNVYLLMSMAGSQNVDPTGGIDDRSSVQSSISNYSIDTILTKFDSDGVYQWSDQLGSPNTTYTEMYPASMAADSTNNLYVTGYYRGNVDFDPSAATDTQSSLSSHGGFLTKFGSPALSLAAAPTATPAVSPTPTLSPTPTASPTPTVTPTPSVTPTVPSSTPSPTATPVPTTHPGPGLTPTPIPPVGSGGGPTPLPTSEPPDTLAISDVRVEPSTTTSAIHWSTDQPATGRVDYGQSIALGQQQTGPEVVVENHSVVLQGLDPATRYYYTIVSSNGLAEATFSGSFLTLAVPAASVRQSPGSSSFLQTVLATTGRVVGSGAASVGQLNNSILSATSSVTDRLPGPMKEVLVASITSAQQNPVVHYSSSIAQVGAGLALLLIIIPSTVIHVLASPWENLTTIPQRVASGILSLLEFLRIRKKRQPWGVIYDSETKQPIESAFVTLYRRIGDEEQKVETRLTGLRGQFGFLVEAGTYRIAVRKTHYAFPSKTLAGSQEDAGRDHLYFGEVLTFDRQDLVTLNIPLDALSYDWNEAQKEHFYHPLATLWRAHVANTIAMFILCLAFVIYLLSPTSLNLVLLLANILLAFIRFGSRRQSWGVVYDQETGQTVPNATIQILKQVNGHDVPVGYGKTDRFGRYFLILSQGINFLQINGVLPDRTRINQRVGPFAVKDESILRQTLRV